MEEAVGTLPASLGRWLEARPRLFGTLDRFINRGRRVKTGAISWFLVLYALSAMKSVRRGTLRHTREMAHLGHWLDTAIAELPQNYDLATEIILCRRLVKGYSDTHARGQSKFDRVMTAVVMVRGQPDAAAWIRRLRQAALLDEDGIALDGALKTVASVYA
jgi:indolepyruvate ferredoxin oxidoreductase beta subunit